MFGFLHCLAKTHRSYYYDTETGWYYLQSRYYDPVIHRFINADAFASTGQGVLGCNMFAYCGNNPVSHIDPSGARFHDPNTRDYGGIIGYTDTGTGTPEYAYPSPTSVSLREAVTELRQDSAYSREAWNAATPNEKRLIVEGYVSNVLSVLGVEGYGFYYFIDESPEYATMASADGYNHLICINLVYLGDYSIMTTVTHEAYHTYQYPAIAGDIHNGESAAAIAIWSYEIDNYFANVYDERTYRKYYNQYLEISANWFAGALNSQYYDGTGYGYYYYH